MLTLSKPTSNCLEGSMPIVSNWSNAFVAVATRSYSRDTQLLQSPPERAGGALNI
jgi:hypothetical protein